MAPLCIAFYLLEKIPATHTNSYASEDEFFFLKTNLIKSIDIRRSKMID